MANIEENQDITDNEDVINDNETVSADNIADNSEDIPAGDNNVEINGEDDSQESKLVSINSLSYDYIISVIEAVLFSVGESVGVQELAVALNVPVKELEPVVDQYILEYNSCKRGIKIVKLEDSYQMCTRNEYYGEGSTGFQQQAYHVERLYVGAYGILGLSDFVFGSLFGERTYY